MTTNEARFTPYEDYPRCFARRYGHCDVCDEAIHEGAPICLAPVAPFGVSAWVHAECRDGLPRATPLAVEPPAKQPCGSPTAAGEPCTRPIDADEPACHQHREPCPVLHLDEYRTDSR